ncbi:hypothetical protein E3V36_07750 [Candidatus Marinimicrobia bacterium MT.SAG.2]|nr:hypothetical protein E3V36_07750 [Candidatus Marinimicrobia bacterium MT.SAG.2]
MKKLVNFLTMDPSTCKFPFQVKFASGKHLNSLVMSIIFCFLISADQTSGISTQSAMRQTKLDSIFEYQKKLEKHLLTSYKLIESLKTDKDSLHIIYHASLDSVTQSNDSLKSEIDLIRKLYNSLKDETDSVLVLIEGMDIMRVFDDSQNIFDMLSLISSISLSNVGNTLSLITVFLGILVLVLTSLTIGGGIWVKKIKDNIETKFKKASDEYKIKFQKLGDSNVIEQKLNIAFTYMTQKQFRPAENMFKSVLNIDPENGAANAQLGLLYQSDFLNKPVDSIIHLKKAILADPENYANYFNLFISTTHAGRPIDEIEESYIEFIERSKKIKTDELTIGKAKLFFGDSLRLYAPDRKKEIINFYDQAWDHLFKVTSQEQLIAKERWFEQLKRGMDAMGMEKPKDTPDEVE